MSIFIFLTIYFDLKFDHLQASEKREKKLNIITKVRILYSSDVFGCGSN